MSKKTKLNAAVTHSHKAITYEPIQNEDPKIFFPKRK